MCLAGVLALSCGKQGSDGAAAMENFPEFYKEGHRGTRGLMPENTIQAMEKGIAAGANFVELDVQVSSDKKVIVSHDAYINRKFALLPDGTEIPEQDARKYILHQMPYDSIRKFDVGTKAYPEFPQQERSKAYIPLLGELIDSVEHFTKLKGYSPVIYNIEIKANPEQDGYYQPVPAELVDLVMGVVKSKDIDGRYYVQSFDVRQIREVHNRYPGVVTGFLTSNKDATLEDNLRTIGFVPQIYSPHYKIANVTLVQKCHEKGMKFVPWTVNSTDEMKDLKKIGVDGIITDYPNLFSDL